MQWSLTTDVRFLSALGQLTMTWSFPPSRPRHLTPEDQIRVALNGDPSEKRDLASQSDLTVAALNALSKDREQYVRAGLYLRHDTPRKILTEMLQNFPSDIDLAADHPNAPKTIREIQPINRLSDAAIHAFLREHGASVSHGQGVMQRRSEATSILRIWEEVSNVDDVRKLGHSDV